MSMLTTTFQYSLEAIAEMEVAHRNETFMKSDEKELDYVNEEDDIGADRMVYGWGTDCPIELADGVHECKSFKGKHNCCQSVISEAMARNYLAKHIYESANHPTHGMKKASFREANTTPMVCNMETSEDRKTYRKHCDFFFQRDKDAAEERGRNRDRDRDRRRSRSARGNAAKGSKGRGKQRKGESGVSAGPIGAAASASSRSTTDDGAIVVRNKPQCVKIKLVELKTLESALKRAMDSQKRTIDSLNFFSRGCWPM